MVAEGSVPKRAVDSPAKAFCLEGNPKTLSSTAHRAEQAPAPAREHGHFVRVRMKVSETTAPSETRGPSIAYAMHQRLLRKPQPPPKPGGQALRTQCKEQLDRGPLTTPKPPLAVYCTLRNRCPLRNQGANHFGRSKHCFASTAYAVQRTAGSGTTDHPETTDRAATRAPDTLRKRRSLRNCGTLQNGGGQSPRVQCACIYVITLVFTPFLPHFCSG